MCWTTVTSLGCRPLPMVSCQQDHLRSGASAKVGSLQGFVQSDGDCEERGSSTFPVHEVRCLLFWALQWNITVLLRQWSSISWQACMSAAGQAGGGGAGSLEAAARAVQQGTSCKPATGCRPRAGRPACSPSMCA